LALTFRAEGRIVGVRFDTWCVGRQYSFLTFEPHGLPVRKSRHLKRMSGAARVWRTGGCPPFLPPPPKRFAGCRFTDVSVFLAAPWGRQMLGGAGPCDAVTLRCRCPLTWPPSGTPWPTATLWRGPWRSARMRPAPWIAQARVRTLYR